MTKRAMALGTAGEHMVAADLLLMGYDVHFAAAGSAYDLIVDIDSRLLRIAVKATLRAKSRPGRPGSKCRYAFHTRRSTRRTSGKVEHRPYEAEAVDLFAFVALEEKLIGYAPVNGSPSFFWLEAATDPSGNRFGPKGGVVPGFADLSFADALAKLS